MPPRKEEWIEVKLAADIISRNSGHEVSTDYVRLLGNQGKIRRQEKNKREHLYSKSDADKIRVRRRIKKRSEDLPTAA